MPTPRIPVPFDDVFTSADLIAVGVSKTALAGWRARGEVVELGSGVFAPPSTPHLEEKRIVFASRQIAIGQHPVTLLGAATLHSLPLPARRLESWSRVDRHRVVPPQHLVRRQGLLVPTLEWTAINLARSQPLDDALIPLDAALRNGARPGRLVECADEYAGRRGMQLVAQAVQLADPNAESPLESKSRGRIFLAKLPMPELQVEVWTGIGNFRVDFYWPQFRLIGEADGRVKYTDADVLWREKRRQLALEAQGYQVMRWSWEDVTTGRDAWLRRLRTATCGSTRSKWAATYR